MIFKKLLCFFIITLCVLQTTIGNSQTHNPINNSIAFKKNNITISDIKIISVNKPLNSYIIKQLNKYKNQKFSKKKSNTIYNALLAILKKRKILQPQIQGPLFYLTNNKINISYTINNPYKYGFILKYNKNLILKHSKNLNQNQLLLKNIYIKYFNNTQLIRKILSYIKEFYLKKGYTHIKLKHKLIYDHKYFIKTIVININKGPQTKIKKIQFYGSLSQPAQYYIQFIYKHSGPFIKNKIFYNADIKNGLKNLIKYLKNIGYLEAKAYIRIIHTTKSTVHIKINLNEGVLTKIKNIYFIGNKYFSTQKLTQLLKIKINKGLNIYHLEKDIKKILTLYHNVGFMKATLNNTKNIIQYNKDNSLANIYFHIIENNQIKISDIKIIGNNITSNKLILNSLHLKIGDIVTPKQINLSLKKLRNLGIFLSVNIITKNYNKHNKQKILIIKVEEKKQKSIRATLGLSTERNLTARGLIEFSHKNIMGAGRYFFSQIKFQSNIAHYIHKRSLKPEYLEHQALISYIEPIVLNSKFNGQINLSNSSQIFSYKKTTTDNIVNIVDSAKIDLLLTRTINNFINIKWTLLSWESRKNFTKNCHNNSKKFNALLCTNNKLNMAATGLSVSIDKRNNILFTSDGFLSQIFLEYYGPLYIIPTDHKIKFIKMEIKHFNFYPITTHWILAHSIQGGFIYNINTLKKSGFPVNKAFILGGVNSLRGFDGLINGERVPHKKELLINHSNELIFNSSSFYFLVKTELRFLISKNITGSVFYDGGMVTISGKKFKQPYRHSVGFGIKYNTPLGQVSGYLAFKISPTINESKVVPHLSFGSL